MLVAGNDPEKQKVALKVLFSSYIKGDERTFAKHLRELVTRLSWAVAAGDLVGDDGMKLVDDSDSESEVRQSGTGIRNERTALGGKGRDRLRMRTPLSVILASRTDAENVRLFAFEIREQATLQAGVGACPAP